MFFDMALAELRAYRPEVDEPADFGPFWAGQLAQARTYDERPTFSAVPTPALHAQVFDVTFPGYGGSPVKAWFFSPLHRREGAPLVVEYVGYGGGRGDPFDSLGWSCAGHPHLVMDNRGQGGGWRSADTADDGDTGAPSTPGFMTRGISSPATYYYTRLFVDAVRAVDAVAARPEADGGGVVVTGGSQGGALALAVAHLQPTVRATMPDVPFLSHARRAIEVGATHPYEELAQYCSVYGDMVDQVFATFSYIDVVNHAKRATAPALFSVGLVDAVTPASTVFAAYNHYAGPKDVAVYQYNGHEGGRTRHFYRKLAFLDGASAAGAVA